MNQYKELLQCFSEAPDTQLDASQCAILAGMAVQDEQPHSSEIQAILDACVYAGLASGFAMMALQAFWCQLKEDENVK